MFKQASKASYGADKVVRRTLADGTVKEYRYRRAKAGKEAPPEPKIVPGSLDALIEAYRRSPEWAALAPATRSVYATYLKPLYAIGRARVADVTRRDVIGARNAVASRRGNGAGTGFMRAASAVFSWGVDNDWLEANPAHRIKGLKRGTLPAWTEAVLAAALEALEEPYRRAVVLAVHTAQRRGDLVKMTWADYDGETIRVRQEKDRRPDKPTLVIPVHPDLRSELEAWKANRSTLTILANPSGKPWTKAHLTRELSKRVKVLGFGRFTVHGLRKLAASRLADAKCTLHQIAAIGGWRTLSMVELYTRSADQEQLARGAVVNLTNARKTSAKAL